MIFVGADCSQRGDHGFWESVTYKDLPPEGSASHCSIVWKDSLYVVGGESFHRAKMIYVYDYNGNVWETPHVEGRVPLPRYAHSCVLYGDKIYMYGGVVQNSTVTNEIWAFDVSAKVWENITVHVKCHNKTMCGPLKVRIYFILFEINMTYLNHLSEDVWLEEVCTGSFFYILSN